MKGFEIGKKVRAKVDLIHTGNGKILLKKDSVVTILGLRECCGAVNIFWGYVEDGNTICSSCKKKLGDEMWKDAQYFELIEEDETPFKQVTYTKIIETIPVGVN